MKAYNCYCELKGLIWVFGLSCSVYGRLGVGVSPHKRGVSHTIPSTLQMPVWCLRIQINSNSLPRWACLVIQMVKNLSAMLETQVQSLAQKDPLEKRMATTPVSCLGNPMDRRTWWTPVHGVTKSQTRLSEFPFTFFTQN